MVFGLLKDIKNGEYRTIATPGEIETIVADGHTALVQRGAGDKAGFADEAYVKAGNNRCRQNFALGRLSIRHHR